MIGDDNDNSCNNKLNYSNKNFDDSDDNSMGKSLEKDFDKIVDKESGEDWYSANIKRLMATNEMLENM